MANAVKQIHLTYYDSNGVKELEREYPLDEDKGTNISFSQEWWTPGQEIYDFLKNVFEAMDVSFVTAIASAAVDLPRLLGVSLKPLNYYAKAWKNPGEPFTITLDLTFRFGWNGDYNGNTEVVIPVMELIRRTVPILESEGGSRFKGPGPSAADVLSTIVGEITGIQEFFSGQMQSKDKLASLDAQKKKLSDITNFAKSADPAFPHGGDIYILRKTAIINIEQYVSREADPVVKNEAVKAINALNAGASQSNISSMYTKATASISDEITKLTDQLKGAHIQMPRTWEISYSGYVFKYLVCVGSNFSFHPEVDNFGYPIHATVSLTFQPYFIALANGIGTPSTGLKTPDNKSVNYGWHQ